MSGKNPPGHRPDSSPDMAPSSMQSCRSTAPHKRLSKVGRSSLSFELPLSFEQAAAYRKANGQYVRKNQWRETTVTVYIDLD